MLRISRDTMYRLAKDPDDPFPIRFHTRITLSFTLSLCPHSTLTTSPAQSRDRSQRAQARSRG